MTTLTAEANHLRKLLIQQERAILDAILRRAEIAEELREVCQIIQDRQEAERLAVQGAAAVQMAERILQSDN